MTKTKLRDLAKNPRNPRTISTEQQGRLDAALDEFGSLDGIVYNRARKELVGGHQRATLRPDAEVVVLKRYEPPDEKGTVAEGYVAAGGGLRVPYREVHWADEAKHLAATVAANKQGGEFDRPVLAEVILRIDQLNYEVGFTGFGPAGVADLVAPTGLPPSPPEKKTVSFETNADPNAGRHECPRCGNVF